MLEVAVMPLFTVIEMAAFGLMPCPPLIVLSAVSVVNSDSDQPILRTSDERPPNTSDPVTLVLNRKFVSTKLRRSFSLPVVGHEAILKIERLSASRRTGKEVLPVDTGITRFDQ